MSRTRVVDNSRKSILEMSARATELLNDQLNSAWVRTDRFFAALMVLQHAIGIIIALLVSPRAWSGSASTVHIHVYAATILGGIINVLPIYLCLKRPGETITRQVIAVAQILWSALLIHLTGGRIETHFHVFGSLALLAFYRDWRVLVTATLVTGLDHGIRGLWWPQSVYGVLLATPWRTLEHVAWVAFEDIFIIKLCLQSMKEMKEIAIHRAGLETSNQRIEREVADRTLELQIANEELALQKSELRAMMEGLEEVNRELAKARADADSANAAKSDFLANMSHEIRTPMTAILGYADLLLNEGDISRAPESRIQAVRTIQRNGDHLLKIINDILDLTKIESGGMMIEKAPCPPIQVVSDVISLMRVRALGRGLGLDVEFIGPIPESIHSDATRLRQILINLIGNAIKFTESGGVRLEVRFAEKPKPIMHFDVVDTGLGISPEQSKNLFKPFSQADASMTRRFGGTGLGLSVSKRLAELLGGDVTIVESIPGRGTRFRVSVDANLVDGSRMVTDPSLAQTDKASDSSCNLEMSSSNAKTVEAALKNRRILVAEDGVDNQRLILYMMKRAGADVVVVENGRAAVDKAMQSLRCNRPFDVILMDMQMPIMDGYEATALLRAKGYCGPVVALTAHAMAEDRKKCLLAGCNDYATKPIDRIKIIETVLKCIERSSLVSVS